MGVVALQTYDVYSMRYTRTEEKRPQWMFYASPRARGDRLCTHSLSTLPPTPWPSLGLTLSLSSLLRTGRLSQIFSARSSLAAWLAMSLTRLSSSALLVEGVCSVAHATTAKREANRCPLLFRLLPLLP